jgi:hypothetical protein
MLTMLTTTLKGRSIGGHPAFYTRSSFCSDVPKSNIYRLLRYDWFAWFAWFARGGAFWTPCRQYPKSSGESVHMFLFQESSLTLKPGHHGWASVLTTHQLKAYEEVFLGRCTKGPRFLPFLGVALFTIFVSITFAANEMRWSIVTVLRVYARANNDC